MKKKLYYLLFFFLLSLPLVTTNALVNSKPGKRSLSTELLKDLGSFYVVVEELGPIGTEAGIETANLKALVETAANRQGISIEEGVDKPFLFINVQL